ncbi:MAG: hypothetical protein C4288_13995 [Leptolyngbya sp. ERB_1_1]
METLAHTEATNYKPSRVVRLGQSIKKLCSNIPSSAWVGFAGFMMAASVLVTHVPSAQAAQYVKVSSNVSALNVRSGPGVNYGLNGRPLYPGETVRVVGSSNGWYQLPDGGWFSSTYTSSAGGTGGVSAGTPVNRTVRATTTVNVRNGPGVGYSLNGRPLYPGETVRVIRESGGWYQLPDGGWFSAAYTTGSGTGGPSFGSATVSTNGSSLLIRSSPGGAVIGSLANGTVVRLSGAVSGGYSQLSSGGWVSSSWLR